MFSLENAVRRLGGAACAGMLFTWMVASFAPTAHAISANPGQFQQRQPDGTLIQLRVRGDEHFNWAEDLDGYTVVHNKGWYEYARVNPQGKLVPTGLKVGLNSPRANGLRRNELPSNAQRGKSAKKVSGAVMSDAVAATEAAAAVGGGTLRNLVVLVRFSDHAGRSLPPVADIDVLFNAPGGHPQLAPTGSVRDVYAQNSYGQLELDSTVSAWITVSKSEAYYANGVSGDSTLWEALREALTKLDQSVDFRQFDVNGDGKIDSITFLHSGYGAEWGVADAGGAAWSDRIWSHQWVMSPAWTSAEGVGVSNYHISPAMWGTSGSQIGRIGVIAHETGHFLGLPDLYDTDGGGEGVGSYGLMGNAWGFDSSQRCPPLMTPWSRMQLGWIDPVPISQQGTYSARQTSAYDDVYMVSAGYAEGEYLLIENRQRTGFDCSLPQGGLAIWHIDEKAGLNDEGYPDRRWPKDGKHYRVALAQADGDFDLERGLNRGDSGDLHHGAAVDAMAPGPDLHPNTDGYQAGRIVVTGHTISDVSASGPTMTFCLNGCGVAEPPAPDGRFDAPSTLTAAIAGSDGSRLGANSVVLTWTDNSDGALNEDDFVIERCEEIGKEGFITCNFGAHATVGRDVSTWSEPESAGTYRYRVRARRGGGEVTGYSNEARI